ncbi:MAG: metallophosphoesterase [Polyangiaceae bacterium]
MPRDVHNLLVLSDVHLGSDLVQRSRPSLPPLSTTSSARDRELVRLLDFYADRPRGGLPWRLVIAGDFVDFVGMSLPFDPQELDTLPTDEELEHGLGSSMDHTLAKLRRVAEHHSEVFRALARFVCAGHDLVIVRGNHDVDFHWLPVQNAFRALLTREGAPAERIEFADWFYYEEGVVYVEHGHQYDDFCSYEHVLYPVTPTDPKRSARSLSDVLLRFVVRPTRGMRESGHDRASALDYLRFGARLGSRGLVALGRRFVLAVATLLGIWREHMSDAGRWVRDEHERKMALLAEARKLSLLKLRALASLQRPPITKSVLRILAGVMLDRVAVFGLAVVGLAWFAFANWTPTLGIALACGAVGLVGLSVAWKRARGNIDASSALRETAARVSSVFPAAFVVMGHTHLPEVIPAGKHSTYVNLGAWSEERGDDGEGTALPATRTHLVVEHQGGELRAELYTWTSERGPERFVGLEAAPSAKALDVGSEDPD